MEQEFEWPAPTAELTDGVVTLRPMREDDAADIFASSADERMRQFTQVPREYTNEMAVSYATEVGPEMIRWAITSADLEERYCGSLELRLIDEDIPAVSVGYNTSPWARGRGIQTRALKMAMDYAFSQGVARVEVKAALDNPASRHVAESAGCTFEGMQRAGEHLRGELRDLAVYSRLASD
ncbi:GNAT family protein [uncultured Rothia sp.]|uniref:GNAT family N-acetyltransferase n=1 Tax=uncultured Rothia sp. TaxID=316088 RepID=UPI003216E0A4